MPSTSPKTSEKSTEQLVKVGRLIRSHRKELGITAIATSEAAGVSRVTLHRIEKGVASVTIGAYFNVLAVLNLHCNVVDIDKVIKPENGLIPAKIVLADYPQLKQLAWQLQGVDEILPIEAFGVYERNSRFIEGDKLGDDERNLIESLQIAFDGLKNEF